MAEDHAGTEAASETDESAPPTGEAPADNDASGADTTDTVDEADEEAADADDKTDAADNDRTDAADKTDADKTDQSGEASGADEGATPSGSSDSGEVLVEGGLDIAAERGRLDDVEQQIEDGRRALADLEEDVEPESDGPPVAKGEGAANAPPG